MTIDVNEVNILHVIYAFRANGEIVLSHYIPIRLFVGLVLLHQKYTFAI